VTGVASLETRQDLIERLSRLGFSIEPQPGHGTGPYRVLVRLHGRVFQMLPRRMSSAQMADTYLRAIRELERQGLPTVPVVDRHARPVQDGQLVAVPDEGLSLADLRKAALVDSLGRPRAQRVQQYMLYREVYRERFGQYPVEHSADGHRTIIGRCHICEQPQELECLPDCRAIDPMTANVYTRPPRGARAWSKGWRR